MKIAGILLAVYIVAELFTLWEFSSDIKLTENKAEKKKCFVTFKRLSILFFAAICAFPCAAIISVYGWESPVYEPNQNSAYVVNNDDTITDIYQENIELIKCFSNETWTLFSLEERITLLQSLESFEAQVLGIPSVEVLSALLDENTLASYDNESNQIWIDIRVLSESTAATCIEGICHETFHAYQYYLISSIDWESELSQSFYFQDARSWMENSPNYISSYSSSYDSYVEQPLETAAHAYAEDESQTILSYLAQ
ncbi:MAG: hypothetical protein LUF92_14885 [Clostridiales bacterium]|nr:hypothetical protein [Clostridiales bacterium]